MKKGIWKCPLDNDLTVGTSSGLPNMDVEDNINQGPNNESIHNKFMESDGDHGHAEEQINIEPTSSEVLNSINMNNKGKLDDTNIPHMARLFYLFSFTIVFHEMDK